MYKQIQRFLTYHLNQNSVVQRGCLPSIVDKTFDELISQYLDKSKNTVSNKIVQILCCASNKHIISDTKFEKLILDLARQNISHDNLTRIIHARV